MTEAELIAAFATLGQSYLAGLQASFTIVSAYLVALYFFLGRAPLLMRAVAFLFFTATLALLGGYLAGALVYGDGIAVALLELDGKARLSHLGQIVSALVNQRQSYMFLYASVAVGMLVYMALFYLTFLHRWPKPADTL